MGAACCVASKDRTIVHGPSGGTLQRHARNSPSWSFRWDNRVVGEETHASWLRDGGIRNNHIEVKYGTTVQTAFASDEGSPRDSLSLHRRRSPKSDRNVHISKLQNSDEAISRNVAEVKESAESPSVTRPSPAKKSPLAAPASPPSQSQLRRLNLTPSRCYSRGPQFSYQVSATQIPELKSPPFSISEEPSSHITPDWGSESTRGSNAGSSDSWSIPVFSELTTTRRDRWSFDSENSGFSVDNHKIGRSSCRGSDSPSIDLQTCGVCAKLLSERSSWAWSCQKIVSTNELAVVSILNCGHVYHGECLDYMTPEINKYDPGCPVCTYGVKQAQKISEKALIAELDQKARKRSRKRVIDSDLNSSSAAEGTVIIKKSSSFGKPFLKRHFSFGSNPGKPLPGNQCARRKGVFWSRSIKE